MDYYEYLKSEAWQEVRRRFYKSKLVRRSASGRPICFSCKNDDRPLELHHKTYKRLGKERLDDLALLCRECHDLAHRLHKARPNDGLWKASNRIIRNRKAWKRSATPVPKPPYA